MFCGISIEKAKQGIENFELTKNRMEIVKTNGYTIINDCYNANFDSMKAAIETISRIPSKRKIAVLGDMLELGNYSKALHEKVGEVVANNNIDILITVGEEAKNIVKAAINNGLDSSKTYIFDNNNDAVKLLKETLKEGDSVLIKASNAMKFVDIVNEIIK